ncbi:MAG: hypothetical protein AAB575_02200 [Patescibacteria group bacterium]
MKSTAIFAIFATFAGILIGGLSTVTHGVIMGILFFFFGFFAMNYLEHGTLNPLAGFKSNVSTTKEEVRDK